VEKHPRPFNSLLKIVASNRLHRRMIGVEQ
jgi:hypothetical protein